MALARLARFSWAELSHWVVMIEVAKAAEVVRRKLDRPEALAVSCGSTDESTIIVRETRKKAMQNPWPRKARATYQKPPWVVKGLRQKATTPIHTTPNKTSRRGSPLPTMPATMGLITTANMPF